MGAEALLLRVELALCVGVLMIGAVTALSSANLVKRVAGMVIVSFAAVLAAAVLRSGAALLLVGIAGTFASLVIGLALVVRLQERYGAVEGPELNAADADSEPPESNAQ